MKNARKTYIWPRDGYFGFPPVVSKIVQIPNITKAPEVGRYYSTGLQGGSPLLSTLLASARFSSHERETC